MTPKDWSIDYASVRSRRDRDQSEYFVAHLLDAMQRGGIQRQDPRGLARLITQVLDGNARATMELRDLVNGRRVVFPPDPFQAVAIKSQDLQWERDLVERTDDEHAAACCKHECKWETEDAACPVTAGTRKPDMEGCDHE